MSKTQRVHYEGRDFWAYDAALAVWLLELVDSAEGQGLQDDRWWAQRIHEWKVGALSSDMGVNLPEDWSPAQKKQFIGLATQVTSGLRQRKQLSGRELAAKKTLDGHATSAERYEMQDIVDAEPIANLGEAIIALVNGTLPMAPARTWWGYGFESHPITISMNK